MQNCPYTGWVKNKFIAILIQITYFKFLFAFEAADSKIFHVDCKVPGPEIRLEMKYIINQKKSQKKHFQMVGVYLLMAHPVFFYMLRILLHILTPLQYILWIFVICLKEI